MEKFNHEIVDLIIDTFHDDKDLISQMLFYLYHTTTDDSMKESILTFFNEENYCIECNNKMEYYEWTEARPLGEETMSVYDCPCCRNMERGDC